MNTMSKLNKISKKELFYKEIKGVIEKNVSEKIKFLGISSDLRKDTQLKIDEFLKTQTILSRIGNVWDEEVYMYMMGEILPKYMNFKTDNRDEKIKKLSEMIYSMFVYGGSGMSAPDVSIVQCANNWRKYLAI